MREKNNEINVNLKTKDQKNFKSKINESKNRVESRSINDYETIKNSSDKPKEEPYHINIGGKKPKLSNVVQKK